MVGVVMVLAGLLVLFALMLMSRSSRRDRRRNLPRTLHID
jgi:hypothetical protein